MISVFGSKVSSGALEKIKISIDNQWLGMGPNVKAFEEKFAKRLKLPNFTLVDSGSNALYMAVTLLNLPKKSEIILPSFTWVSCAQAILLAGHIPVFCDVDIQTHNVTVNTITNCISKKTGAIMIVHYAGLPVEMEPILKLGYPIIEDAAHAVDSSYKGKACGSMGTIGIYSFDAVKNLTMGEGGGITTNNAEMFQRTQILRYCGIGKSGFEASTHGKQHWWEYNIQEPFIKMNPSDIQAAIGLDQLEHIDELQAYRKKIWNIYQKAFLNVDWLIKPQDAPEGNTHSYFTYNIRVKNRDILAQKLFDIGIYTTLRYHPLHLNKLYNSNAILPNSLILNKEGLSIPLHPNLTLDNIYFIVDSILKIGNKITSH